MSATMWVLRFEPRSSGRAVSAFNHGAIIPSADSSKSHKDAIPVKTRECLFPASICQRWSRKEDRDVDHFSENVSLQAQIQLDWEAKPVQKVRQSQG